MLYLTSSLLNCVPRQIGPPRLAQAGEPAFLLSPPSHSHSGIALLYDILFYMYDDLYYKKLLGSERLGRS